MNELVKLVGSGHTLIPKTPSSYSSNSATLVDSARNVQGYIVSTVIRENVAKVELGWKYMTVNEWSELCTFFANNFEFTCTFFNQDTGTYDTRTMYCGDRNASMFRQDDKTGAVVGWTDCKVSLIEV